jgi:hypothetical protein
VQSSNDCVLCHTRDRWVPANFDHAGVTGSCYTCHNGSTATGKGNTHIPSGTDCETCHSTNVWAPAPGFDHDGQTASCFTCHNGTYATGKNPGHIAASNECELCHSRNSWIPAGFDHSSVTPGTCATCHDGNQATGTPNGHFSSTLSCDRCHTTQAWTPDTWDHAGSAYPGDHRTPLLCTDCHGGNSAAVTWSAPAYQPDCAGCHANDYRPGVDKHRGDVSLDRDCAGTCHQTSPEHSVRSSDW